MEKKRRHSLKWNMLFSFLLVALILTLITLSYYFISQNRRLREQLESDGKRDVAHSMRQIESQTEQVSDFVSWALHNEDILSLMERDAEQANDYDAQYHAVITQLVDQLSYRPVSQYLQALFLVGENGLDIRSGSEASLVSAEIIEQLQHIDYDKTYWGGGMENGAAFTQHGWVIPYCHSIRDAEGNSLGVLIMLFSEEIFLDCYDGLMLETSNQATLYNREGDLLCSSDGETTGNVLTLTEVSDVNGWRIDMQLAESTIQQGSLLSTIVILGILLLAISLGMSWKLTQTLAAPIERIIARVRRISNGEFVPAPHREEKTEMDYLENCISDMQDNIVVLMERERQREQEKQKLELRVLQEQMNPHFLYHTLNTIRLMADMQGKKSISNMTSALGKLLRANLSIEDTEVSLEQELDFLESYLYIQNISQKGRLRWSCEQVEPDLLSQRIPKFLLQPLAENAITHGFAALADGGTITISGTHNGDIMTICVSDNGEGMTAQRLEEIRASLARGEAAETDGVQSNGVALLNVQKRIRLHYGSAYGISIESEQRHGCRIEITLPFRREEEDECHMEL